MAKNQVARGKLVRKYGANIFGNPKYDKLLNRKSYSPGQHGQGRRGRLSNYGLQLKEKQKIKFMYGLLEKQFSNCFKKADKMKGETGTNLLQLLERRLDNVVYRLGFSPTRPSGRQLVNHGHFIVNGKKVNIPSALVKRGDIIQVREKSKKLDIILESVKRIKGDLDLPWLELDKAKMKGTVLDIPERDQMDQTINDRLVVELYSK
jgi:small subunit ribosomal protein S4|tara:strand:+ start:37 stop:654 length:618 start_codon:yes stop_codon:yes gene_type:complete